MQRVGDLPQRRVLPDGDRRHLVRLCQSQDIVGAEPRKFGQQQRDRRHHPDIDHCAECHDHSAAALFGLAGALCAAGPPDLQFLGFLLQNVVHRVIVRRLVRCAVGDKAGGQVIAEGIQIFLVAEFRGLDRLRGALGVVRLVAVQLLAQVLEHPVDIAAVFLRIGVHQRIQLLLVHLTLLLAALLFVALLFVCHVVTPFARRGTGRPGSPAARPRPAGRAALLQAPVKIPLPSPRRSR